MYSDQELFELLPSSRTDELAAALARRLEDVERFFLLTPEEFVHRADGFVAADYFARNVGATRFEFEDGVAHGFAVWPSQLSVVLIPNLEETEDDRRFTLSTAAADQPALAAALGSRCSDVRIWTLRDDIDSDEAKEVAVSYAFENGAELMYCIYLHGDMTADYLLPRDQVSMDRVERCFSLARQDYIDVG